MARCLFSVCLICLGLSAPLVHSQSQKAPVGFDEAQVKAAFLFRLPRFVRWPDGRTSFHFCFEETSDISATLQALATSVTTATVTLLEEETAANASPCDVVFNPSGNYREEDGSLLLISDIPNFAADGGMIEIGRRGSRLHLSINVASLQRADLTPSSQLLTLSTLVGAD